VDVVGLLSVEEVQRTLLRSDVFLLVSDFEGLPISLLEAMSAGCVPVVYNIKSGVPDAIEDGASGILVPHGDISAMARTLVALHSDRRRLESISQAAVQRHAERFSLERMSAAYRELFCRLLAQEKHAPRRDGRIRKSPDLTLRYRLMRKAGFLR
jgi:glycosyltransferase involved in cell wall biosynthesis